MNQETESSGPSGNQNNIRSYNQNRPNNSGRFGRGRHRQRFHGDLRQTANIKLNIAQTSSSNEHQDQNESKHNVTQHNVSQETMIPTRLVHSTEQHINRGRQNLRRGDYRGHRFRRNDYESHENSYQIHQPNFVKSTERPSQGSSTVIEQGQIESNSPGRQTFHRRFLKDRNTTSTETQHNTTTIQSESSENELKTNSFECMICCDNIHRSNSIWYCSSCYNIFHLKCAIEWCNKSIKSRDDALASALYPSLGGNGLSSMLGQNATTSNVNSGYSDYRTERLASIEWPCPACREILHTRPGKYKCFCGKVTRPEINRHLTPHSCGQMCGRKRPNENCPHTCNAICHPGRCNPCLLTSRKTCFCGKLTQEVKCSAGIQSCGQVCGKPLNCEQHFCSRSCHDKSCDPCDQILTLTCYCGNSKVQKRCDEINMTGSKFKTGFSCGKICSKLLDCGKHSCDKQCHPGSNCPSCKLLSKNLRTCPCGSTQVKKTILSERVSCTDPIPTCENRCNRTLACGPEKKKHVCQKRCHTGYCPPCKLKSTIRCECSLSSKTVDCSSMYEKLTIDDQISFRPIKCSFNCDTRCNKPKNCGRHRCQNKCCKAYKESNSPLHKCDQICNKKLSCGKHNCPEPCHTGQCGDCTNIGWEELKCHCGSSTMYPPIPCGARPPVCHRPCRRAHSCGHPVKHECHDDDENCAPCIVWVKKPCFCGAESRDNVYCYQTGYSCGRTCKKQLNCKQHQCRRVCHDNECETPNERGVIICSQPCPHPRFICKHPCALPCHGRTSCMPSECKKVIEVACECGNRTDRIECSKLMKDVDNRNKVAMLSMNRSNQDCVMIDLSKKTTTKTEQMNGNPSYKKLDCDENCAIYKRNKALAEALEIAQPDLKPTSIFGEDPLRLLKEATAHDYKFVAATYNSLVKFIKAAKESDKRFIFMKFPPADKLRREVIYELAHHFSCTSEADGEEPFRHVIVRAYKNKSCSPEFNIEQLLPVTD